MAVQTKLPALVVVRQTSFQIGGPAPFWSSGLSRGVLKIRHINRRGSNREVKPLNPIVREIRF